MKILMISDVYFPRINGVSTSIETFRQALAALGHPSTLIAPQYPGAAAETAAGVIRVPSHYLPFDPEDRVMKRAAVRALIPQLRAEQYDVVHVQTPFVAHYAGLELARALGLPCVTTYHTYFEEYLFHYVPFVPRSWLKAAARRVSREQCNQVDAVVVPSRAMDEMLARYGVTRPREVLPTGIPPDQFHGGEADYFRERYGIARQRRLLLFVGRTAYEKNIDFLIEMVDHLRRNDPSILLLITGEGPALPGLKAAVRRRGIDEHVRFLGYLDRHTELHDCYRAADLFVFASRTETQGLVLLEAMALGTPVVALAEMGTRDILAPQRGCRIAPPTPQGFAAVVRDLLANTAMLDALGVQARAYARNWSADEMARRLARLYEHCCAMTGDGFPARAIAQQ
jgi:1,2-diacylglycerol 3-alpha-glucosyltransferase